VGANFRKILVAILRRVKLYYFSQKLQILILTLHEKFVIRFIPYSYYDADFPFKLLLFSPSKLLYFFIFVS